MAHGDEQGSTDEVKVFKHEEDDEENLGAEDLNVEDGLTEDKSSLITESETVSAPFGSRRATVVNHYNFGRRTSGHI